MFSCRLCEKSFETQQGLKGHLSHCLGNRPKVYRIQGEVRRALGWSDIDVLREAVAKSESKSEVIKKMGGILGGGYFRILNRLLNQHNISTTHFLGQGHLKGKTHPNLHKRQLSTYLIQNSSYSTSSLRKRLVAENVFENKCSKCGCPPEWGGEPLTIQLHHINGDCWDHRIENLLLLCPNCHSQTDNFGKSKGSEKARKLKKIPVVTETNYCLECKCAISSHALRCKSCAGKLHQPPKIEWPPLEELLQRLAGSNFSRLGEELGVSDNAIRKHIKAVKLE